MASLTNLYLNNMPENNQNNQQNIAIAELKIEVKNLKERLNKFINNEFFHLQQKVDEINNKLLWGFLIGIMSLIIVQIILRLFEF